jgi:aryl-alcohol dehydrogenase-like predicted oxidoreductase
MNTKHLSNLMIGTAQWGSTYGKYNEFGKCSTAEINKILQLMRANSISDIDTSSLYGDAHTTLNKLQCTGMKIYTKVRIDPDNLLNKSNTNRTESLSCLPNIHGLSIHNSEIINNKNFLKAVDQLNFAKEKYNIKKLGISIYDVRQLERLYHYWTPDIIQIPFNFFNDEFMTSGALEYIKAQGTQIHARSLFCQGLLLQEPEKIHISNERHMRAIENYHRWCETSGITQIEACLSLIKSVPIIDKFVLGFDTSEQLKDVAKIYNRIKPIMEIPSFNAPLELYDPRYWPENS